MKPLLSIVLLMALAAVLSWHARGFLHGMESKERGSQWMQTALGIEIANHEKFESTGRYFTTLGELLEAHPDLYLPSSDQTEISKKLSYFSHELGKKARLVYSTPPNLREIEFDQGQTVRK